MNLVGRTRHPLSHWLAQFTRNQPLAGPTEAWRYLRETAATTGMLPWLAVDGDTVLVQRPSRETPSTVSFSAFSRQLERIKARTRQPD